MKKIIFSAGVLSLCIATWVHSSQSVQSMDKQDITLLNVEALTAQEEGCHYTNGYVAFTKNAGGAYDCCQVWVNRAPNTSEGHCR